MKVIVCLKEVLDPKISLDFGLENTVVFRLGSPFRLNPPDVLALNFALGLKAEIPAVEVIAVSIGTERVEHCLRLALASGADKAMRIREEWPDRLLPYLKARFISALAGRFGADLVLCGSRSLDTANGQVGGLIAGMLGVACLGEVVALEYEEKPGRIAVVRDRGGGKRERLVCRLPCVVTVKGEGSLPYASLDRILAAEEAEIACLDPADLGLTPAELADDPVRFHRFTLPKPPLRRLPPLDCSLPAYYRILQLIEGGIARRTGKMLAGSPAVIAEEIFALLRESGVFHKPG
ncbi:MAG: hypothetical protein N2506_07335 [Dehalococcoidales bacterium]|nr:hypothetical protein [Dehalococcoidales bacterium]